MALATAVSCAGCGGGGFSGGSDADGPGGGALLPPRLCALQDRGQAPGRPHAQVLQHALHQSVRAGTAFLLDRVGQGGPLAN